MQEYAKEHTTEDVPCRLLIGSYFCKKIRLSTPLLKWYTNHRLVITHIYTVVKYIPNTAVNSVMTQVAQARLDGDCDKDKALITETMKLIGNSSYGKLITNKENIMTLCMSMSPKLEQKSWTNIFTTLLNFLMAIMK